MEEGMKCFYENQCGLGQDCSECYQAEIQRLEEELREREGNVLVPRESLEKLRARCAVFDDGTDGADGEAASSALGIIDNIMAEAGDE